MKKSIVVPLMLAAALLTGCASLSPPTSLTPAFAEKVASAKTAKDHQAIVAIYDAEAAEAKQAAASHRSLAKTYGQANSYRNGFGQSYAQHCEQAAKGYDAIAADKTALAQLHRQLATQSADK